MRKFMIFGLMLMITLGFALPSNVSAKVDWKSMVLLLTALTGALGFVWNKVELYVQNYRANVAKAEVSVNQVAVGGAYEALALRMDELFLKMEALEAVTKVKTTYVPVTKTVKPLGLSAPRVLVEVEQVPFTPQAAEKPAMGIAVTAPKPKPEPVSKRFSRARLPEFEAVQAAAEVDLEDFLREVSAK